MRPPVPVAGCRVFLRQASRSSRGRYRSPSPPPAAPCRAVNGPRKQCWPCAATPMPPVSRLAGSIPSSADRQLDPGKLAQVEFEPVQHHCLALGIDPVIELKIGLDRVAAGQLAQIESVERFLVDRNPLGAQFREIRRLIPLLRGEIEILHRDPIDMDRFGLDALGRLGRRFDRHAFQNKAVIAERLAALVAQHPVRGLAEQVLELR